MLFAGYRHDRPRGGDTIMSTVMWTTAGRGTAKRSVRLALSAALLGLVFGAASQARADETADLKKRVQQLEQQLVDMQVVMGTLETLAKGGGGGGGAAVAPGYGGDAYGGFGAAAGGADSARIDGMEMQIRALSAQMEQLSEQMRQMSGGGRRGDLRPSTAPSSFGGVSEERYGAASSQRPPAATGGFGSTTVTQAPGADSDPITGFLTGSTGDDAGAAADGWRASPRGGQEIARAPLPAGDPKQAYETAYGYLLQQDYASAETAFADFVRQYPNDNLASNAQYWLGETHFVRGAYKSAAGAFLKGYESYRSGSKAPDSLLKLAMSLERLGQKEAACSSLAELTARFPQAPDHVRRKARSEQSRVGC